MRTIVTKLALFAALCCCAAPVIAQQFPCADIPALTGDASSSAGSCATTVNALKGVTLPTLTPGYLYYSGSVFSFSASGGMVWPSGSAGIPNYSGSSSWGTSYSAANLIPAGYVTYLSGYTPAAGYVLGGVTPSAVQVTSAYTDNSIANKTTSSPATLTDGSTVTWAIGSAFNANAKLTFTTHGGSRTLALTGLVSGGNYTLILVQDSSGTNEGLTFGSGCSWKVSNGGGGAVTTTTGANAIDILSFYYDGSYCYANFSPNFS